MFEVISSVIIGDLGKEVVNQLFDSTNVFYRLCSGCQSSHQLIFYQRLTSMPATFSIYSNMIGTWASANNVLNIDFKLFNSYSDYSNQQNPWQFCNYDDSSVAFPRECIPSSLTALQWNSLILKIPANADYGFYVLNAPPTFTPTTRPTALPSAVPSTRPTALPTTATPTSRPTYRPSPTPTFVPTNRPTATPTTIPTIPPTATPSFTPIPTSELTFHIYDGLLFNLSSGGIARSITGYAQNFGSLHSATDNSIRNYSLRGISVNWNGYLLTPDDSMGSWTFWSLSDFAVDLWIDGEQIIMSTSSFSSNTSSKYFPVMNSTTLQSNTYYPIRIRYESSSPPKMFQILFASPISKISSDFNSFFYFRARPLVSPTIRPSNLPTEKPIFKPSRKPVTESPSKLPTAEPTMSSDSIQGLLFNVYSTNFGENQNFFSSNVPYLAGFTTDLSLSSSINGQRLLPGDNSIEWFGYLYIQTTGEWKFYFTYNSDNKGYFWIGKNPVSGYTNNNAFPFDRNINLQVSKYYFKGDYVPIRIRVGGSEEALQSFLFQFLPACSPDPCPSSKLFITDGSTYFVSARPHDFSVDEVVMMHEYLFDDSKLNDRILTDAVGGLPAYLSPSVELKNGKALFNDSSKSQFIQLHSSILLFAESFSIELWVEFSSSNNRSSTLFSFGQEDRKLRLSVNFNKAVYIAVVYSSSNTFSVYADGLLTKNSSFSFDGFPVESILGYNFIGRNPFQSGPGMTASIEAIRIWYGELSSGEIFSNHISGFKSSSLIITEDLSLIDINVTYYATTIQQINVGLFGGNSTLSPMFGPETTFLLSASDTQCPYNTTAALDANTSTATIYLSAMNYSITIQSAPPNAPTYTSTVCDPKHPTTSCKCTVSKPALQYLQDSNGTTQSIVITIANSSAYEVTFIYESGMCFDVVGSEAFALFEGEVFTSNKIEYSCFPTNGSFVPKGSNTTVYVSLFARYPIGVSWILDEENPISSTNGVVAFDYYISNALVYIDDQVSGAKKTSFEYKSITKLSYTITASFPRPSPPFSWQFSVLATNYGLDGIASVMESWYLVVLGVIPNEVPNFYPISTNPDMIFMALRDPPGGASSVTIAAGSIQYLYIFLFLKLFITPCRQQL